MDEISIDLPVTPGVDLLQRVPLFRTLGFTETMMLSSICSIERKSDAQVIIHQDSLGQALYILKEGAALVRRRDPITGLEKELAQLRQGELFGEMSLVDDQLASADVVARGEVELLVIPRRDFEKLLASNDKLAVKVYRCFCAALSERLRKANAKVGG
ncbi:MAG TPA: cyclic nucleotide-binding domain-containing protein [Myxococcales bacterium]|nr:cyclic nucleotide-binding domain-containing protein [Myxococcales bacterium]